MFGKTISTINTYGIHHFNGGWLDENQVEANSLSMKNYDRIYQSANEIE